jgi:hypothetical protein
MSEVGWALAGMVAVIAVLVCSGLDLVARVRL